MLRLHANLALTMGLLGCVGMALLGWTEIWLWKPNVMAGIPTPLAQLALQLGRWFSEDDPLALLTRRIYLLLWGLHLALFAAAYYWRLSQKIERSGATNACLLLAQIVLGLIGHQPLLILVALELPLILPLQRAGWVLAAQVCLAYAVRLPYLHLGPDAVHLSYPNLLRLELATTTLWQLAGLGVGYLIALEHAGRLALAKAHAELVATQMLLSDAVRVAERTRIARDLHDVIGHHLTAQNLHLDLALRQAGDSENSSLRIARELAQRLLAEIRQLVSAQRSEQHINLQQALQALCAGIPQPKIVLTFAENLQVRDPALANVLLRSVQEAVSNTIRHANATELHLNLQPSAGGVHLTIHDNGRGMGRAAVGNGLNGMRERVEEVGGTLTLTHPDDGGLRLDILLPEDGR